METNKLSLCDIYSLIKNAEREGAEKDAPEGTRWIRISDTLANIIVLSIEEALLELGIDPNHEDEDQGR